MRSIFEQIIKKFSIIDLAQLKCFTVKKLIIFSSIFLMACSHMPKVPILEIKKLDDNPTMQIGINPVYMQIYTLARGLI